MNEKLFAYYRVSTEMQDIATQKDSVEKFIKDKNVIIAESFIDKSQSGSLGWERKAFKEMFDRLEEVDGIVVYAWDRLSREEAFAMMLMYSLKEKGKVVYEALSGMILDFDNLFHRGKIFFDSALAEEERKRIKQRQKDGIKRFKNEHGYWGQQKKYGINPLTQRKMSKKTFWEKFESMRVKNLFSKSAIARFFQLNRTTFLRRLEEEPEEYRRIEEVYRAIKDGRFCEKCNSILEIKNNKYYCNKCKKIYQTIV